MASLWGETAKRSGSSKAGDQSTRPPQDATAAHGGIAEKRDGLAKQRGVGEDWGDVLEDDPGLREIDHVTDGGTEGVGHHGRNVGHRLSAGKCKTSKRSLVLESRFVFAVEIRMPDFQFIKGQRFKILARTHRQTEKFLHGLDPPDPEAF